MANAFYGNVWYCDTAGIVSKSPVRIKAIEVDPASIDGLVLFNWWDEANPIASSEITFNASASGGTVTETNTATHSLTATLFPATAVVKVLGGSGLAANHTYHLNDTVGENHRFIVTPTSTWTDEGPVDYHTITYPARIAFGIATPHVDLSNVFRYFGARGVWLPNLILETATNAVATIYLAGE